MPEPLHRITYEAAIDDVVDVAFRLAARTQAFRKQLRLNVIIAVAGAVAFGVMFARLFKHFFIKEMRKQHRKMIAEQFGGKPTIPCELELRADAVWVRQLSRHVEAAGRSPAGTLKLSKHQPFPPASQSPRFLHTTASVPPLP